MGERYQAMGLQEAGCHLNGLMIRKQGRNVIGQHMEQMKKAFTVQSDQDRDRYNIFLLFLLIRAVFHPIQ